MINLKDLISESRSSDQKLEEDIYDTISDIAFKFNYELPELMDDDTSDYISSAIDLQTNIENDDDGEYDRMIGYKKLTKSKNKFIKQLKQAFTTDLKSIESDYVKLGELLKKKVK